MLNLRLYRTCWLVAGVALVVALLTLQTPEAGPEASLPSTIDGQGTLELSQQLAAIAPDRPPGSAHDLAAARWVQGQLAQVPGGAGRVRVQDLEARANGERVSLQNVYLAVPGTDAGRPRGGILVVAPRDTPAGVVAGTTSTAVMLRLAQASGTTRHQRPHLFVSTDGSTLGNAGLRWFLERFSSFPLSAAIVLDAPGEANGDRVHVWIDGRTDRQALGLGHIADRSVQRAGGRADGPPSLGGQLLRLGVPQTFGDQGAAIAAGLTSVTLSARAESPLREGRPPTADRLEMVANSANDLLGALDAAETVPAADGSLAFAGKFLRPTIARLTLLLLLLPVLVCSLDILARQRRARVPLGAGVRAVGLRAIPLFAALGAAYLLALAGLLPGAAAGAPPIPADARFGALAGLAIVLAAAAGVLGAMYARRRGRRVRRLPRGGGRRGARVPVAAPAGDVDRAPLRAGARHPGGPRGPAGHLGAPALAPAGPRGPRGDPLRDPRVQPGAGAARERARSPSGTSSTRPPTGPAAPSASSWGSWWPPASGRSARSWWSGPSRAAWRCRGAGPAAERPPREPRATRRSGADAGRW